MMVSLSDIALYSVDMILCRGFFYDIHINTYWKCRIKTESKKGSLKPFEESKIQTFNSKQQVYITVEPLYSGHHFVEPIAFLYWNLPLYGGQLLFIKICYKFAMSCTNENIERKDLHDMIWVVTTASLTVYAILYYRHLTIADTFSNGVRCSLSLFQDL